MWNINYVGIHSVTVEEVRRVFGTCDFFVCSLPYLENDYQVGKPGHPGLRLRQVSRKSIYQSRNQASRDLEYFSQPTWVLENKQLFPRPCGLHYTLALSRRAGA